MNGGHNALIQGVASPPEEEAPVDVESLQGMPSHNARKNSARGNSSLEWKKVQ